MTQPGGLPLVRYYDRDGKPVEFSAAIPLLGDAAYRRVAEDVFGTVRVSTVWLGLDHSLHRTSSLEPPLIFETLVFSAESELDGIMERYATLAEAEAGHRRIVEECRRRLNGCAS